MINILIPIIAIVLFIIAIVSPYLGGKIQHKTNKKAGWLKSKADWLWDPITWWAKVSIESARKVIVKVTAWGKKTRKKLPF